MKAIAGLAVVAALVIGACDFNLTNPNSPSPIGPNATADQVKSAAVGVLVALRVDVPRIVLNGAILGREGYRLDTADPRFTSELLEGPLDPSNDAFGGGQWAAEYRAIQSGYAILNVIGSAQITAPEKDGVRGFVHTIQALAFMMILNSHTADSIPIDVNRAVGQPLAPFVKNDSAYVHVIALLDSGKTELQAATDLPFDPGPGFTGFNTPATFLKFNRALAARVWAYRASPSAPGVGCTACWDSVLTNLSASFLDASASLDLGAYHVFSTGNQDVPNPLAQDPASAIDLVHPFIKDSADTQNVAGGLKDKRYLAKVTPRGTDFSLNCLTSGLSWIRYPSPNSAIPIIRNEELFLLRAEANWFSATPNKGQAVMDLNFIRTTSGNVLAYTVAQLSAASTDAVFENALLHERLYSLLYEGAHRWIDMRRYGRLNQVIIDRPSGCPANQITKPDVVFSSLPINSFEVQARQ
jgi:starch-binding outer membrane protein, SusD/RagB family